MSTSEVSEEKEADEVEEAPTTVVSPFGKCTVRPCDWMCAGVDEEEAAGEAEAEVEELEDEATALMVKRGEMLDVEPRKRR